MIFSAKLRSTRNLFNFEDFSWLLCWILLALILSGFRARLESRGHVGGRVLAAGGPLVWVTLLLPGFPHRVGLKSQVCSGGISTSHWIQTVSLLSFFRRESNLKARSWLGQTKQISCCFYNHGTCLFLHLRTVFVSVGFLLSPFLPYWWTFAV